MKMLRAVSGTAEQAVPLNDKSGDKLSVMNYKLSEGFKSPLFLFMMFVQLEKCRRAAFPALQGGLVPALS